MLKRTLSQEKEVNKNAIKHIKCNHFSYSVMSYKRQTTTILKYRGRMKEACSGCTAVMFTYENRGRQVTARGQRTKEMFEEQLM